MDFPPGYNPVLARLKTRVQDAQTKFLDEAGEAWQLVLAGELSYEEYTASFWHGEPYDECAYEVWAAAVEYHNR